MSRDNDSNRECGCIVSAPLRRVGPQRVLCVQYTTVCYAANNTQVNNARWVRPYNVLLQGLAWGFNSFTYVCVDSSRTILEHHKPFHSYTC